MMPRAAALRLFWITAAATAIFGFLFWSVPGIDLATSRLFGDAGGFPVAQNACWQIVRGALRLLTDGIFLSAVILAVLAHAWRNLTPLCPKILDFWVFSYILIPGLLVNSILKATSGRARPRDILEFGGDAEFTQAFLWTDHCARNCSFVSGEGSAMAAFGILVTLLFWRHLKRTHLILLLAICTFGALLRVVSGAHFLSDVLVAMTVTVGLITLGYLLLRHYRLPGPFLKSG